MPERVQDALDLVVQEGEAAQWFDISGWKLQALLILLGLLVMAWTARRVSRFLRACRPVTLHPNLRKYAGAAGVAPDVPDPALLANRRKQAGKILATSSTARIAGYTLLRQIEAVHVDGFHRPEDAAEGLKAVAAMKGANAVTNVRTARDAAGRYAAGGDAVLVRAMPEAPSSSSPPPPAGVETQTLPARPEPQPGVETPANPPSAPLPPGGPTPQGPPWA